MAGDYYFDKIRDRIDGTGTGTNAGVTVSIADAGDGFRNDCVGIQCSGDAAALVTIESPAATVLWRKRFAGAFTMSETFPIGFIQGAASSVLNVKISASTANCEANIQAVKVAG